MTRTELLIAAVLASVACLVIGVILGRSDPELVRWDEPEDGMDAVQPVDPYTWTLP